MQMPASAKRNATPNSGARPEIWYVIACQVVPQTSTQMAKSCQVRRRAIKPGSIERVTGAARHSGTQSLIEAFDDDGVHAERECTVEPGVGAILPEHVTDGVS